MPSATITSTGQITILIQVRTALGLTAGDKVDFVEVEKGQYAIRPKTRSNRDQEGCVPGLDHVSTIEEMNESILNCAAKLEVLPASREIAVEQEDGARRAFALYVAGNADFADCLISASASAAGYRCTVTFDRKAARDAGMHLIAQGKRAAGRSKWDGVHVGLHSN
jgi:AbrB family looped-hinge helix DNA binding protein